MAEREERYVLDGQLRVDDAYLGCERRGGKAGCGSENKIPFIAAISLCDDGHPLRVTLTPVAGFSLSAIGDWARGNLTPGSIVQPDGLVCFGAVLAAGCIHQPTVVAGQKPRELPAFKWINTLLGNLKTSLTGRYPAFAFRKYASRYRLPLLIASIAHSISRHFTSACSSQPHTAVRTRSVRFE